jgi:hypothetical protein
MKRKRRRQERRWKVEVKLPKERPGPLDNDQRYCAPARAKKRFSKIKSLLTQETVWGTPIVREWQKGELTRLYWPDNSYLYVDPTGAVRSSGGEATRAKFNRGLRCPFFRTFFIFVSLSSKGIWAQKGLGAVTRTILRGPELL